MRDEVDQELRAPFAIPNFWQDYSADFDTRAESSSLLFPTFKPIDFDSIISLPESTYTKKLHLPDLSSFEFGPLENVDTPDDTDSFSETEHNASISADKTDIWRFSSNELSAKQTVPYPSWDSFLDETKEPPSAYTTEAGPQVFDAILQFQTEQAVESSGRQEVVHLNAYITCLSHLAFGRSSLLFEYDANTRTFHPTLSDARISGYTSITTQNIQSQFLCYGNSMKFLEEFVADTSSSSETLPSLIALSDAVSVMLATVQRFVGPSLSSVESLLQLQSLFHRPGLVIACFIDIVLEIAPPLSDEQVLSRIYEKVQQLENKSIWLRDIILEVLSRVTQPWLNFVGGWVGLHKELGIEMDKNGPGKSFVSVKQKSWIDDRGVEMSARDYVLNNECVPSFMTDEDARMIFDCGKCVRFLKEHHPDHPLSKVERLVGGEVPHLDWRFSWEDMNNIEAKSKRYEKELWNAIQRFTSGDNYQEDVLPEVHRADNTLEVFGKDEKDIMSQIQASAITLNQSLPAPESAYPDRLRDSLQTQLSASATSGLSDVSTFAPPVSLTPILSFCPFISTQARLVNTSCLRMIFVEHKLRTHLTLQRRYQLFGDGVFSSRLAHALFDPKYSSAERKKGTVRTGETVGLRLGSRESWPPASSELRLALAHVLTESYQGKCSDEIFNAGSHFSRSDGLPGGLNFAVRGLTAEEIEKCIQPDAIEALDFLRLQYKPPPSLEMIITPTSLYKYDCIFKILLRAIRMLFTVNQLFRDAADRTSYWHGISNSVQRFRIEAHHFVTCVCDYFFQVGIGATWQQFEDKLDQIESLIKTSEDGTNLGHSEGLDSLRDYHERILDKMMFAIFLRKRQQPVMELLEEIFSIILCFARYSRTIATGMHRRVGEDEEVGRMHMKFKKKVGVFINVCRGLSQKRGYGGKSIRHLNNVGRYDGDELPNDDNTIGQLLLRLDMSTYYSEFGGG